METRQSQQETSYASEHRSNEVYKQVLNKTYSTHRGDEALYERIKL